SNSTAAWYGAAVVGLSAVLMHLWQGSLITEAVARVLSAFAMVAFHVIAWLAIGTRHKIAKFTQQVAMLWRLGSWCFVWTILAGVFALPFHYSQLAPIGGQLLIAAWLLCAVTAWRRS